MALSSRWQDRNLSRIELAVSLLLISIFIGVFSLRALKVFALAEHAAVILTVNNMNTALKYRTLMALSTNDFEKLAELESINPMQLIDAGNKVYSHSGEELMNEKNQVTDSAPANYIGELYAPDINDIEPGHWYFDRSTNLLIYRVKNTEFFYSQLDGPARIRFSIKLDYDDLNKNDKFDPETDKFVNINIESVDSYKWNN